MNPNACAAAGATGTASVAGAEPAGAAPQLKAVMWDMDGTLIDSEPLWHAGEMKIAAEHGGYWDEELAWQGSGTPVPHVAARMAERGCKLPVEEIGAQMIQYVTDQEMIALPWCPGVLGVLEALRDAGIPSALVTTSPRELAENLIAKAPLGAFATYVCGDDDVRKKPDPEPYLTAAARLGIPGDAASMAQCIAIEDSMSGLKSAAASGATTLRQTAFMRLDNAAGPQFADIHGYEGLTVARLQEYVEARAC